MTSKLVKNKTKTPAKSKGKVKDLSVSGEVVFNPIKVPKNALSIEGKIVI